MNKLEIVMQNVMAAFNTFGIEYDVNEINGFSISRSKEDLLKAEHEILNFQENNKYPPA